jgi:ubiquinone/menaquinone biosynthesis C-methylase UbiE
MEEKSEPIERIRAVFNEISPSFDTWVDTLQGKVYGYVTWEHLSHYLPADKGSLILDAGGGTGRWSVPLAKMGYRVTLCDISDGMLKQAEKKIKKAGLSDKVTIEEQDLTRLSFEDQTFDFVLCEDGPISISDSQKVVNELVRVLKIKGKIWASVLGRYPLALAEIQHDPETALKLCRSELQFTPYKGIQKSRVFTPYELQSLFQRSAMKVIKIYGNRIVVRLLPERTQTMTNDDNSFLPKLAEMELYLSEVPSLLGMAEYLQIVGEKKRF